MILQEILETKKTEVARLASRSSELRAAAQVAGAVRDFAAALRGDQVSVIAEFKRRSPSAGVLSGSAEPGATAAAYAAGGARAMSVLTDGPYFGGSMNDLMEARASCSLPVIRKDFITHELQIVEARAAAADAVLLIVRALEDARLVDLVAVARDLGMSALIEVHSEQELERALATPARVLGVNARNLETFELDVPAASRLIEQIPADRVAVAESGIRGAEDVRRVAEAGADAVLVGGWLMGGDPADRVAGLACVGKTGRRTRPAGPGP